MKQSRILMFIVGLISVATLAGDKRWPKFEDFPVRSIYPRKPVPARINSRRARLFRTVIRNGAMDGPNFAGHYTIVSWGCGSGCMLFAIVDVRTGEVYFPRELTQIDSGPYVGDDPLAAEESLQFRKDSQLLIAVGRRYVGGEGRSIGKYYYKWRNNRLKLIDSLKRGY